MRKANNKDNFPRNIMAVWFFVNTGLDKIIEDGG